MSRIVLLFEVSFYLYAFFGKQKSNLTHWSTCTYSNSESEQAQAVLNAVQKFLFDIEAGH